MTDEQKESDYDRQAIRDAIEKTLRPHIPVGIIDNGVSVIEVTTEMAMTALRLFCGYPHAGTPRGILTR